jgi:hypothetical protein
MLALCLQVPTISALAFVPLGLQSAMVLPRSARIPSFVPRLLLLVAALVVYYTIACGHRYFDPELAVGYVLLAAAAYATGYSTARAGSTHTATRARITLLAAVSGAVVFAALSVAGAGPSEVLARLAPHAWTRSLTVNATAIGGLAVLGLNLLAVLAFRVRSEPRLRGETAWLLALGLLGLYANVVMQNRGPFISLALALLVAAWMFARGAPGGTHRSLRLAAVGGGLALAVTGLIVGSLVANVDVIQRFRSEGFETARYELWWTVLSRMWEFPTGGRAIQLPDRYAHNLWLDVAWEAGPAPALLLFTFHSSHALALIRFFRGAWPLDLRLVLATTGVGLGITCFSEPALQFPIAYFGLTCFYLGLVLGLSETPVPGPGT